MKKILPALALSLGFSVFAAKPHAVLVVGTTHYNPGATMPALAREVASRGPTTRAESDAFEVVMKEVMKQAPKHCSRT